MPIGRAHWRFSWIDRISITCICMPDVPACADHSGSTQTFPVYTFCSYSALIRIRTAVAIVFLAVPVSLPGEKNHCGPAFSPRRVHRKHGCLLTGWSSWTERGTSTTQVPSLWGKLLNWCQASAAQARNWIRMQGAQEVEDGTQVCASLFQR